MNRPTLLNNATLLGHKQGVYALTQGVGGAFYTSGSDGQVAEWSTQNPGVAQGIAKLSGGCWSMTYLPDKHLLVAAQNQEGLHIISTEMRQAVGSLALGNASIYDVLALDNGFVAVADGEGWVKIIDPVELKVVAQAQVSAQSVRVLCQISHDTLAAGGSDGCIRLLDMQTLQASQVWQANAPTVMTLCALPNGRLASGGRDARIKTWDLTSYTEGAPTLLHDVPAHHYSVYSLALHPGGELLLSSSMDKTLKIWDANTLSLLRVVDKERYKGHSASVNRCMWLSEKQALSASDDRTAVLWDLAYPEA